MQEGAPGNAGGRPEDAQGTLAHGADGPAQRVGGRGRRTSCRGGVFAHTFPNAHRGSAKSVVRPSFFQERTIARRSASFRPRARFGRLLLKTGQTTVSRRPHDEQAFALPATAAAGEL